MLPNDFILKLKNGKLVRLSSAVCNSCNNTFFVQYIGENEPQYCCYCGIKFRFYQLDDEDFKRDLGGRPLSNNNDSYNDNDIDVE